MLGAKVFISYKRDEEQTALVREVVEKTLREQGYEPLIDDDISGGERWSRTLYDYALGCSGAVILASPEATKSDWCRREWAILAAREATSDLTVVPVCLGLGGDELGIFSHLQMLEGMPLETLPKKLVLALGRLEPWTATSDDYLALHSGWNAYQYKEEPVLASSGLVLANSYIRTECGILPWSEIGPGSSVKQDPFDDHAGGRHDLLDAVLDQLLAGELREPIVIQGPAGAGKSAFTIRLANALIAKKLTPVRIRFRDMRLSQFDRVDEMLADAVRVGPVDEDAPSPPADLFSESRLRSGGESGLAICSTVFILDGWDEVSLAGNAGYSAQLSTWLPKIRDFICERAGLPVRLIVTGRPSLEVKDSGFLSADTPVLTLRPMRPEQLAWFANVLAEQTDWGLTQLHFQPLLNEYQRQVSDGKASGVEMLGLPLLAFLALRTVAGYQGDVGQLISSKTELYKALIDQTVQHAGKTSSERIRGAHRGEGLRALLTRTAAIVSVFWSERISFEELQARLAEDRALREWVDRATQDNPWHKLVVNFYFKGGHVELGCEFLHKSFREYLFAEAILGELIALADAVAESPDRPDLDYWEDFPERTVWHRATRRLSQLMSPQWLTPEIRDHLFWLIDRDLEKHPSRWVHARELLEAVYGWWAEGVHLRPQPLLRDGQRTWANPYVAELLRWAMPFTDPSAEPMRASTIDGHLGYALIQLTAYVHFRLQPRNYFQDRSIRRWANREPHRGPYASWLSVDDGDRFLVFKPGGAGFYRLLSARWETVRRPFDALLCLPGTLFVHEDLRGLDFSGADLRGATFMGCDLGRTHFHRANLTDCLGIADI